MRARAIFFGLLGALAFGVPPFAGAADELNGEAALREWVQPAYPAEAAKQKIAGHVQVDFAVDEEGRVTDVVARESSHGMFEEPALAAVRQWKFAPALVEGKPVACGMTVLVEFALTQLKQKRAPIAPSRPELMPQAQRPSPPRVLSANDPDYPEELEERKLPGRVDLRVEVGVDGRVDSVRVRWASHPAFVAEAVRVARTWMFEPARQGVLARKAALDSPAKFSMFGITRADLMAANGLRLPGGGESRVLPEPFVLSEPVYPFEKLIAGEEGYAEAAFRVKASGAIDEVEVTESSAPEFGQALRAAMDQWAFRPAQDAGQFVAVRLVARWEFRRPTSGEVARLAGLLAADSAGVSGPAGLDEKLAPVWRGFPTYPTTSLGSGEAGEAEIEFVIDRRGRARVPRVVSATKPEFGWAAATAVQQWVFAPPKRGGAAVDVRVRVPIDFTVPR